MTKVNNKFCNNDNKSRTSVLAKYPVRKRFKKVNEQKYIFTKYNIFDHMRINPFMHNVAK